MQDPLAPLRDMISSDTLGSEFILSIESFRREKSYHESGKKNRRQVCCDFLAA